MKKRTRELAVPSDEAPPPQAPHHELQALWLRLAGMSWTSVVVLPASADGSTVDIACSLADVGSSLSDRPVSALTVTEIGSGSARALAALAGDVRRRHVELERTSDGPVVLPEGADEIVAPAGRMIIGVPSVVAAPVSLAVAQAADLVILVVELGRTSMKDLARSIALIGRDRIAGCVLL